ncbi:MAG: YgiQ family radical SAM protein, partial [candidate division Zixibacteria bacterium]|nr:YgiQ family radical SAM protein [candidate division Zixibacteria bacterium]
DSPFIGVSVIGKMLMADGYRVGIIAQPDVHSNQDITRLGEPALFWGVSGGSVDSMVANYTATGRRRRSDDYTPGGENTRRPDRACIVYSNLIRRHFKQTRPIVLGGIEASLRRIAHYDFWSDRIRKSILFDAKADYLVYGMGERTIRELTRSLAVGDSPERLRGLCYISRETPESYRELPAYDTVSNDKRAFIKMFRTFYDNCDPVTAKGLYQQQDSRFLVQNPPAPYLEQTELDSVYAMEFENEQHPYYARGGDVKALETIRFSVPTHRGCYGECNFCSIAVHEGRTVRWRSEDSVVRHVEALTAHPKFTGHIRDVGGPTANMYGFECARKLERGACKRKRCLYPSVCKDLKPDHLPATHLLERLRGLPEITKAFVASGIRHDLILKDRRGGRKYLREVVAHHVSGQMKIAPEHSEDRVLSLMGKPGRKSLLEFRDMFYECTTDAGKNQFLTYYLIAAHPGCTEADMVRLREFTGRELRIHPEQVQIFTPLPSTWSAVMYYTETDPETGRPLTVEKTTAGRSNQKAVLAKAAPKQKPRQRRSKRKS